MTHPINNKLSRVSSAVSILLQVHLMKCMLLPIYMSILFQYITKFVCLCVFFKFPHVTFVSNVHSHIYHAHSEMITV